MCLIIFSYQQKAPFRLVLVANRDEFYDRPTAPMHFWKDNPDVLAGRDLKGMGTWMGITRTGRFAAITNYREPGMTKIDAPSRGRLISDYLSGDASATAYLNSIKHNARQYNGYNLLVGNAHEMFYFSNRSEEMIRIGAGIFGLSNRLLDSPWPKVKKGKKKLLTILNHHPSKPITHLLDLLKDQIVPPHDQLPDTGVGIAWEKILSPIFITSPTYGTRCSTILTIDQSSHINIIEHTWKQGKAKPIQEQRESFSFPIRE